MGDIVPIVDPNRGFRVWSINEIYTGQGEGNHVPNKDDLVFSYVDGWMRVTLVDYTTGLSEIEPFHPPRPTNESNEDGVVGVIGPGLPSESFFVYLDTSVMPHTLAFDNRLVIPGSASVSVKVFRGTRLETDPVISRLYDNEGQLLGENIPLELVEGESGTNTARKRPVVAHSSESMPDGEVVTVVVYNSVGSVTMVASLLVKNTQWIRRLSASTKYVTAIELDSPFLSESDNRLLECPLNIPMDSIARRGIVHYSNGDKRTLPIDGGKFNLFGLKRFISTILGQRQPMTLVYYLSEDEVAYGSVNGDTMHLTEDYLATTVKVDGAYSVKLFTYPVWIDAINGYRLEHFLHNLDRDEVFRVTGKVLLAANSQAFDPVAYGVSQDLTFRVDLSEVSDRFKDYRHLQTTRITLLRPGTDVDTKWTITYDRTKPAYGENLEAEIEFGNGTQWKLRIDNGKGSREHWLRDVYEPTLPLYDQTSEATPPTPNYMRVIAGPNSYEVPISMWEHEFLIDAPMVAGETVFINFMRRDAQTDWELGTSGLAVRVVSNG